MKYLISLSLIVISMSSLKATPIFFSFGGEEIIKISDFPDNENFKNIEGKYYDAGIKYKQVTIFFIPLWNYDEEWCLVLGDGYYIESNKRELDALATLAEITLPEEIELPFWDKFGGKILLLSLVFIYILYKRNSREEKPEN